MDELHRLLKQAHLKIRPIKSLFSSNFVDFMGHLVGGDCFTTNEENLVKDLPNQSSYYKNVGAIVIGLANYYRDYIPSFAAIASSQSDLSRKGLQERLLWDDLQKKAFFDST